MCARYVATSESNDNAFIRLVGIILSVGAAVSVAVVVMFLLKIGFTLEPGAILYFVLIDAALVAFAFFLFGSDKCNRNNGLRFLSFALAGLMLFVNLFVASYLNAADDLIVSMNPGSRGGVVEYSIVAQRSSNVQLSTRTQILAGIQSTDTFRREAERETKKLADASFMEFDNVSEVIGATQNDVDVAVIQSAMLRTYAEYFPDSFDNLDVIATFRTGTAARANETDVKVDITKPFSVYVSGLDVEGDINQVGRSDSNMLILVDPVNYKMMLINTPRDYYVQLHGTRGYPDKLSHAGVYGIDVCEQTIGDLYNIDIDYHVQINFTTITTLVESMGGILVDNPRTFELWGQTYKEGVIWLNGDQALLFARARKGLQEGDLDRGKNQQLVIEGIIDRITTPDVVIHYKKIISNLSGTFLSNLPASVITQLFSRQITYGGDWSIEKLNATGSFAQKPTYSMGSEELSVIIPDQLAVYEIQDAIQNFMRGNN